MTVITMSRTEIDRMSVLQDLAASRIKVTEAATLMRLGRGPVSRLAKAYGKHGPQALVSRRRGRPSNRAYPADLRDMATGIIRERSPAARQWRRRSSRSFMTFTWRARRFGNG